MGEGDCYEITRAMYLFLDRELDQGRRSEIQAHLDDCPPCYEAFEFEFELWQRIRVKCREQVPPTLRARVFGALGCEPPGTPGTDPNRGISPG